MKRILGDLSLSEIKEYVISLGEGAYRAKQLFDENMRAKPISEMTTISKTLRTRIIEDFEDATISVYKRFDSKIDETSKFLFELCDGELIEAVLMKYKYGNTVCVSTQVGCRMGCAFCASGLNGLIRNLTAGEILSEVTAINSVLSGGLGDERKVTNIVLMGSGEPFDNYQNVIKFLRLVSDKDGLGISPRNISLSTCGLVPKIYDFISEGIPLNLTLSLHSPFDEKRKKIMPIANSYAIKDIIKALDAYFAQTGRRYIVEYVLIRGENDTEECAEKLKELLGGKPCHINLIRLNEVKESGLKATVDRNAYAFMDKLNSFGLSATVRRQIGTDIEGACGQLRRRVIGEENKNKENKE